MTETQTPYWNITLLDNPSDLQYSVCVDGGFLDDDDMDLDLETALGHARDRRLNYPDSVVTILVEFPS